MLRLTAIASAAVLVTGVALAHKGATGIIAERMAAMKNMGHELKAIGDMLVGHAPLDSAAVVRHAIALHENCHRTETMFPAGSIDHHSRALPAIWERPDEFQAAMQRLHRATESFVSTASLGDRTALAASVKQIGEICSGCHQTFRATQD